MFFSRREGAPRKIDGRALLPSPMLRFAIASAKQLDRSMKKTSSCKRATELPGLTSSLIGQKNVFLANQRDGFRPLLELVW